jgi:Tol biopolymer transport system component
VTVKRWLVVTLIVGLGIAGQVGTAMAGPTTRVSVSQGVEANNASSIPSISANGRFIVFRSTATNLGGGDTNGFQDIFVHDRGFGISTRVSVHSSGAQADGNSLSSSISANGRFVAFSSFATNLVDGDLNGKLDVFVHDRQHATTTLVSVHSLGAQGDGHSLGPSISADGRFVAFESFASNLVEGDANGKKDIFVHDRKTGTTTRVSVDSDGVQGDGDSYSPAISANGQFVAFVSSATNLVAGDTNGSDDVFVHERRTGITTRVSVDSVGFQANGFSVSPSISANGRFIAFASLATNLVGGDTNGSQDIFVHDLATRATTRVSVDSLGAQAAGASQSPAISGNGRFVAFSSPATDLVAGDTNGREDVFVHDRTKGTTTRVSVDSAGTQADFSSGFPSMSNSGRFVAFDSTATNLVEDDTKGQQDIFVHDRKGD